jgi:hypothetical protein
MNPCGVNASSQPDSALTVALFDIYDHDSTLSSFGPIAERRGRPRASKRRSIARPITMNRSHEMQANQNFIDILSTAGLSLIGGRFVSQGAAGFI